MCCCEQRLQVPEMTGRNASVGDVGKLEDIADGACKFRADGLDKECREEMHTRMCLQVPGGRVERGI